METLPQESRKCHTQNSRAHPNGSHVGNPQWWPACYFSHMGHCNSRSTSNSTMGVYATPALIWLLAPVLTTWVHGNHLTLQRGEPMESSPLPVITAIPAEEAIDPYKVMGMAMKVTRLLWNQATSKVLVDIHICSKGIVGLGLEPEAENALPWHLEELLDSWQLNSPPHHSALIWFLLCHLVFLSSLYVMMFWCHF